MPDRRASLLVRLVIQNHGRLSKSKRSQFTEISDTELAAIEAAIQRVVEPTRSPKDMLAEAPLDDIDLTRHSDSGRAVDL
jgi:hypothetical protein